MNKNSVATKVIYDKKSIQLCFTGYHTKVKQQKNYYVMAMPDKVTLNTESDWNTQHCLDTTLTFIAIIFTITFTLFLLFVIYFILM